MLILSRSFILSASLFVIGLFLVLFGFASPIQAAPIFSDDFETGNTSNWTSSNIETPNTLGVTTSAKQSGTYGMHVTTTATNDDANVRKQITPQTDLYMRSYVRLNQDVGSGYHKMLFVASSVSDGSPFIGALALRTNGTSLNRVYSFAAGAYRDAGVNLVPNQWYCMEAHVVVSPTNGKIQLWKDDVLLQDVSGINTGSTAVSWARLGNDANPATANMDFDDFVMDTARIGCTDTTPPVLSNGVPAGTLPSGTTSATISLTTNENAICKYDITSGIPYPVMPNTFTVTGTTSHSAQVSGLSDGNTYNYYVKCQDAVGNPNTADYPITFSVANPDTVPPTASISIDGGSLATTSASVNLSLTCTDASGVQDVRYSNDGVFDTEAFEAFSSSKNWTLLSGDGEKTVWYQCRDASSNQNVATVSDAIILDTVSPLTSLVSVSGDTTSPYEDTVDDNSTVIVVSGETGMTCRWYATDVAYSSSSGTLGTTTGTESTFTVTPSTSGSQTKYISCIDSAGNGQNNTQNLDVNWTGVFPDTTPPVLSNGAPSGALAQGTTQATLSLTSNENATCKYATTSGVSYSSMTNTFSTTGTTSHSTQVTGLSDESTYNYYVRCQDALGNVNGSDYNIVFAVASASLFSDWFESGNTNNWNSQLVEAGNTLGVTTQSAYSGTYGLHITTGTSNDDSNVRKQISSQTDLYLRTYIRLNQNIGTGYHKMFITGSSASDGSPYIGSLALRTNGSPVNRLYSYAAGAYRDLGVSLTLGQWSCLEMRVVVNSTSGRIQAWKDDVLVQDVTGINTGTTPVTWLRLGADSNSSFGDFDLDGFVVSATKVGCGGIGGPDTTPPTLSDVPDGSPARSLPSGTTSTNISVNTNENATCKYSITAGVSYPSMTNTFTTTGAATHSTQVSGLTDGSSYNYYVRCQDTSGNPNTSDYAINFSVSGADIIAPSLSNGSPTGSLPSGTTQATLSLASNENATCKYSTVAGTSYSSMTNTFTATGTTNHSTQVTGLSDGNTYNYFVRCQDQAGNPNTTDYVITFSVASPQAATLTRYPFIQNCATNSLIVVWKTNAGSQGVVEYSTDTSYGSSATDGISGVEHAVTISGLTPGTTYNYRVKDGVGTVLHTSTFRTGKDASNPFYTFVGFGDSGEASTEQKMLAKVMNTVNPDFMIHAGDIIYQNGEAENYDPRYFSIYRDTIDNICMFPSLGNHDINTLNGQPFYDAFYLPVNSATGKENYYSYDYGNAHVTVIDSTIDQSSSGFYSAEGQQMVAWAQNDLATTTKPWKFVYFHHSPYSAGPNHGSDMRMRDTFGPIFEQNNVDVVFAAHEHNYQRSTIRKDYVATSSGVLYVVSGGGGGPLYGDPSPASFTAFSANKFNFTRFDMRDNLLLIQAIDQFGNVFDAYSLNKGTLDSTAPVITGPSTSSLTSQSVSINWQTDDATNTKLEYGLSQSTLDTIIFPLSNAITYQASHSVPLDDLEAGTTYYYKVTLCNMDGGCTSSSVQDFTTLNPFLTTVMLTNLDDTRIDSDSPTTDFGTSASLAVGRNDTRTLAFLMKWNTSLLPSNAIIHKATLGLYVSDHSMDADDVWNVNFKHVYDYPDFAINGAEWDEGDSDGGTCNGNELCWSTRPTNSGQMSLSILDSTLLTPSAAGSTKNFSVDSVLQEAVNMGEASLSFYTEVGRVAGEDGLDDVNFRSKEIGGSAVPTLTVEYYLPN